MNPIAWMCAGAILVLLANAAVILVRRSRASEQQMEALKTLRAHGYRPERYYPGVGENDPLLRRSLDAFRMTGHVVLDADGKLVGKTQQMGAAEPRERVRPKLTVVVSNELQEIAT